MTTVDDKTTEGPETGSSAVRIAILGALTPERWSASPERVSVRRTVGYQY